LLDDDFDPSRTVILEEEPPLKSIRLPRRVRSAWSGNRDLLAERVVISADSESRRFLVLSDTYYPGWEALVDGGEIKIYQADYLFRAVSLEQGKHVIEFRYRPRSFRVGLTISLISGAILCVGAVVLFLASRLGGRAKSSG